MSIVNFLHQTLTPTQAQRLITALGHLFFATFLFGCIWFYQERLLAFDAGYYTFHLLNYEEVFVKHNRYISYFTQGVALAAVKAGASMKTVMMIYSGMFGLWFYIIFLFIRYVLKNYAAVLLLMFSLCLTMRYKHYAGHTEITFALVVATLLFALLTTKRLPSGNRFPLSTDSNNDHPVVPTYLNDRWYYWLGLILICAWLYIIHPIIVLPLSMWLAADILYYNRWRDWRNWLSIGIIWATFGLKFLEVSQDTYESGKVSSLGSALSVFTNFHEHQTVFYVVRDYFVYEYYLVFPLFIAALVLLFKQKRKLLVAFFAAATLGLVVLNIVIHSYLGGEILIMIDGYMGMLGMIWGLAIVYGFIPYFTKVWWYVLLLFTLVWSVHQIETKHLFFERRLEAFDRTFFLNEPYRKLYVSMNHFNWGTIWYPYQVPLETLMWTSLEDKNATKTILVDVVNGEPDSTIQQQTKFLNVERLEKGLNGKYFNLPQDNYHITDRVGW